MSRVIIPINVKLNAFILVLLSGSIVFYVYYAINLFQSDKMAYVFEAIKSQNKAISDNLESKIEKGSLVVDSLAQIKYSSTALQEMFNKTQNLKAFLELKNGKIVRQLYDEDLNEQILLSLSKQVLENEDNLSVILLKNTIANFAGIINKENNTTYVGIFDYTFFTRDVESSRLYNYGLLDTTASKWINGQNLYKKDIYKPIKSKVDKMGVDTGTFILKLDGQDWIVSFDSLPDTSMVFTTLVQESKALEASQMLKHKSIFFGTFVLSLAILLGFLFSRIFTVPIKKLYEGSRNFVSQNFESRVNVKSWDELGVLADSFNTMADDIEEYMKHMEEKSRLENEMKTAQLVQNSFFEGSKLTKGKFQISSFYSPASECGGDWWGCFEHEGHLIVIMVDATGHGTAAALITAVIHNCLTALKFLIEKDSGYLKSSGQITNYLNQSVCNVKSKLMATAFVAVFDQVNNKLTYTNASHNPPLLLKNKNKSITKSDIIPLMDKIGKRLGEDTQSHYEEVHISLNEDQRLLFYTDGLIEGENDEGKQWGKRKLLKILLDKNELHADKIIDSIVDEAYAYFGEVPQADDICIVGVERI